MRPARYSRHRLMRREKNLVKSSRFRHSQTVQVPIPIMPTITRFIAILRHGHDCRGYFDERGFVVAYVEFRRLGVAPHRYRGDH